ncbi:valine--tRNA ligase [Borreliella garinii Far04]|nr:valine--tRNA ligase [Borreliella garinii Far04]
MEKGFLQDVKKHRQQVGHCYRSGEVIEPYLSTQWFVSMKPLAEKALKALESGELRFYPKKWENTYKYWLSNIKDWCISRQLVWGHRIPAWYNIDTLELIISDTDPSLDEKNVGKRFVQDPDVLDTWFSSWLWPFSSLGWPNITVDFENYYPTNTLITAYDIIFFWVARMVMAGLEFTGQIPFRDVYITPLLRDKQGRKMSKSLGNGIDPLDIIHEYGSDSLRFTLSFLSVQGQDLNIDAKDFMLGAKFANKVFNASKFILLNLENREVFNDLKFNDIDKWLLTSLNSTILGVESSFANYKYNEASKFVYEFFWNDFCDWYIEISKIDLNSENVDIQNMAISKLLFFLKKALLILHPFIPFVTEKIYSEFSERGDILALNEYPSFDISSNFKEEFESFKVFKTFIVAVRTLKSEFNISPSIEIDVALKFDSDFKYEGYFKSNESIAKRMINFKNIFYNENCDGMLGLAVVGFEIYADVKSLIDKTKELIRLEKQLEKYKMLKISVSKKLENENFLMNAPKEIIESEKLKFVEFSSLINKINSYIINLKNL